MPLDLTGIKTIIFDLGEVILNLDFQASVKAFRQLGLKEDVLSGGLKFPDQIFYELQIGVITPEEFRKGVRRLLKNKNLTDQQIDFAWCAMLLDIPFSRIKIIQELRKKYRVFLFSNTNKIHIDKLHKEFFEEHGFEFPSVFDKVYYSQDIHDAKPDVSAFEKVINDSGINPKETLFVDDLEKNIIGAQKADLKGLWLRPEMDIREIFAAD